MRVCGAGYICPNNEFCGSLYDFDQASLNQTVAEDYNFVNFNWGITNFDTTSNSLVAIFQTIFREGWADIAIFYIDATGRYIYKYLKLQYIIIIRKYISNYILSFGLIVLLDDFLSHGCCLFSPQSKPRT